MCKAVSWDGSSDSIYIIFRNTHIHAALSTVVSRRRTCPKNLHVPQYAGLEFCFVVTFFQKQTPFFPLPLPFTPPRFLARQSDPELYQAAFPVRSASCLCNMTLLSTQFFFSFPCCLLLQSVGKLYSASVTEIMFCVADWCCTEVTCCFPVFILSVLLLEMAWCCFANLFIL